MPAPLSTAERAFFPSLSCHRRSSYVLFCETRSIIFSAPDNLLSKILILLFISVAGLLTVFGYYASSICIIVVLAGFLAVLFDPLVVLLEKLHLPRGLAATGIVLAGIGLIGLLGYVLYEER